MTDNPQASLPNEFFDIPFKDFVQWTPINDSIMGGSSYASCRLGNDGLALEGEIVEEGGGFVSCRSASLFPPMNLSSFRGLQLELDGAGLTLKLALACQVKSFSVSGLIGEGLRWAAEIPTESSGTSLVRIPFKTLKPSIRAKPIRLPLAFDASRIIQFQLLCSKFGLDGKENMGFRSGPIKVLIRSIKAFR